MPSNPAGSLLLPDGTLHALYRDQIDLTREEIVTLAELDKLSHKHKFVLLCALCDKPLLGGDNRNARQSSLSVACSCREFVYRRGAGL